MNNEILKLDFEHRDLVEKNKLLNKKKKEANILIKNFEQHKDLMIDAAVKKAVADTTKEYETLVKNKNKEIFILESKIKTNKKNVKMK